MTNREKLNTMSNRDMATFLAGVWRCDICANFCPMNRDMPQDECIDEECVSGIELWLRREVYDD